MDTTLTRMTTLWIARNRADGSKKNTLFLPRDAPAFARSPWLAPWPRALSQSGTQCAPRPDLTLHSRRLGGCCLTATALTHSQLSQRMLPPPGGNREGRPSAHLPRCRLGKAASSPCSHWKKTVQQRPWPSSFQNTGLLFLFQLFSAQTGLRARGKRGALGPFQSRWAPAVWGPAGLSAGGSPEKPSLRHPRQGGLRSHVARKRVTSTSFPRRTSCACLLPSRWWYIGFSTLCCYVLNNLENYSSNTSSL